MTTTIKDIAVRLGISHSTVSRALTGYPHVNETLRQQILSTAREMGYHANVGARRLKEKRTQLIGLLIPDLMIDFYARAATILQAALAREGYRLLLSVSGSDPSNELAYLRAMLEERVEGLIWVPWGRHKGVFGEFSNAGTPVVQFGRTVYEELDAVLPDDETGVRGGVEHLLAHGHTRIALLVGERSLSSGKSRLNGYLGALRTAGLDLDDALVSEGRFDAGWGYDATDALLRLPKPPTAIMAASSTLLTGALKALRAHVVGVPDEISIVGFGDPDWYDLWRPPITTMAFATEAMSETAATRVLALLRSEGGAEGISPVQSRIGMRLISRESVAVPGRR